ncbi:MAG TPA: aconitate hydratase AcnA [Steroidobacteraceae bacterium]|nr:aconitate hydratase AcnA [Steroidobacteraceae bacterium]
MTDSFKARTTLPVGDRSYEIVSLAALPQEKVTRLPYSLKVLLENLLRFEDGVNVTRADIEALLEWQPDAAPDHEIAFTPARVILQDFTGVPCIVDLAAMREAIQRLGGDAQRVNPLAPAELVIDHSVQVDEYGSPAALAANTAIEFKRNVERYAFLRWGQKAFDNFRVVPPNTGIVHQVNLEYLARVIFDRTQGARREAYPDTLVGTDSHTTMVNGLGVLGWGVGGIEAEAAMLGQPITMLIPQVIGVRLTGSLRPGATATDLVLTVTEMLRKRGVVDKFVEYFGDGLASLPLADRATIGNMAPEYGSTCGIFPIDEETVRYLELTGRPRERVALVETYAKSQGLWRTAHAEPRYTDVLELDLGTVEASLAGPRRPQDRVPLRLARSSYQASLKKMAEERVQRDAGRSGLGAAPVALEGKSLELTDGAVLIAAITSCTNTSNPSVMLGAGLLARNAHRAGLKAKPWVKTSLAPGSRVVTDYYRRAGLLEDLEAVGFDLVGYGCTTCIAAGTPVLLADGTSRKIEQMPSAGGKRVWGPTGERTLGTAVQTELLRQGERECVTLALQDGRTLVCTPDHELLRGDGRWVRADSLDIGRDRVVMGLEAPLDEPGDDEVGYELASGSLRFDFSSEPERARMLAFARLVGHLISDGSISVDGQARMCVGQALDREAVLNDVELLTHRRPVGTRYDERKWTIVLPTVLADAIAALPGVRSGRCIDQAPCLPQFVLAPECPVAVAREFLGGLFGADGDAPTLHRQGSSDENAILLPPAYAQSAKPEHVQRLEEMMRGIVQLLVRCGVKARGARVGSYPTRRSRSSYPSAHDGVRRIEVRLQLTEGLSFVERVGYRYCLDKSLRASAAAVYWRTVDTINRQRLWMADRLDALRRIRCEGSFREARRVAAMEMAARETPVFPHYSLLEGHDRFDRVPNDGRSTFKPMHRKNCGFPSPAALFSEIGVREWFAALQPRTAPARSKRYCTGKEALAAPTFALKVIDRRPSGTRSVFDLSVSDLHAFVAGTVCVHNCIGNSGPLKPEISSAVKAGDLIGCAVLSGNRNFEGRVHPEVRMNFLASPPLVVAYALAGSMDVDLATDPLGTGRDGRPVYLKDIWPTPQEVQETVLHSIDSKMFRDSYRSVFQGDANWAGISTPESQLYAWDARSTYVKNPPYFAGMTMTPPAVKDAHAARVLALLGDSVTTDHISPAGNISKSSPAAKYLIEQGVQPADFNSYGARRGNHEVMMRGTFANIRLRNLLAPGTEGGVTLHLPDGEPMSIYDAAMRYKSEGTPLVILAGREYGTGSSRDWAAKGTMLLGVRAVIAESFERIHRSNLIGMGVLPLQFPAGASARSLGLTGKELFDLEGIESAAAGGKTVKVRATAPAGTPIEFDARIRIDTPKEREYFRHGGILQYVLRQLAGAERAA